MFIRFDLSILSHLQKMTVAASEAKRFYVGNLSSDINEAELRSLFERFGPVAGVDVKNKRDIDGNVIASFAFVKVENLSDVDVTNVIKVPKYYFYSPYS